MADFCRQCSLHYFGEDFKDFADISKEHDTAKQHYAGVVCEGCGHTHVDHNGICRDPKCTERHGLREPND